MNASEHLSPQSLSLLARNELPQAERTSATLHLSYCPICRALKDELSLKAATERMWSAFPSAREDEQHIDNLTFESFWSGELQDEATLAAISYHCVACSECRKRREAARVRYQTRLERGQELALKTLVLATAAAVWRKRKLVGTVLAALVIFIAGISWFGWKNRNQNSLGTATNQAAVHTPNSNSSESVVVLEKQPTPTPSQSGPDKELLARADINLRRVPDGAGDRAGSEDDKEPSFRVVASRTRPTRMRITLPPKSKKGLYYVTIREPAFLREVALTKGVSADGITLALAVKLGHLSNGEYVLRIERQAADSGNKEYVGDYKIVVTKSPGKKPAGKANR